MSGAADPDPGAGPDWGDGHAFAQRAAARQEIVRGVLTWLLMMLGFVLVGALLGVKPGDESPANVQAAILAQSVASAGVLLVMRRFPPRSGWSVSRDAIRLVTLGYPAFFLLWTTFVAVVYTPAWEALGFEAGLQPQLEILGGEVGLVRGAVVVIGVVIVAPVFEEVVFRGYLLGGLATLRGKWFALVATSLVFGLLHASDGFYPVLPLAIFGAWLGWLRLRTGSLWAPVMTHALHNGLTVALTMLDVRP